MVGITWIMIFLQCAVAMSIFFKPILEDLNLDRATLSSVQTLAMLLFAGLSPIMGRLIDRFGPKAILFVCAVTQALSGAVTAVATGLWQVYLGRFLFEIRSLHAAQVLINRWFIRKRGKAQGIVATGMPMGTLILSPISQYMVLAWGWRETLLFWSGIILVIFSALTLFIRNSPEEQGYHPDSGPLPDAPDDPREKFNPDPSENRYIRSDGSRLSEAFKSLPFWLLSGAQLFCGVGCGFIVTHVVIFATDLGYSEMIGASFLSVLGGINMIGVLVTGYMSDRIARSKVLALTHIIRALSFFIIVGYIYNNGSSLWLLYVAMALFGFGFFTTAPLASGLVADLFGNLRMGTIIGAVVAFHAIGMAAGAYAGGLTFEMTGSYYSFLLIQAILELIAAIFAFLIRAQWSISSKNSSTTTSHLLT
jgi:MFS family permease